LADHLNCYELVVDRGRQLMRDMNDYRVMSDRQKTLFAVRLRFRGPFAFSFYGSYHLNLYLINKNWIKLTSDKRHQADTNHKNSHNNRLN
jgi:hypothetical protein